ncbi:c-type cytochrome [Acidimangrovimonas pyrenivorans]|uniref:C-type cytochrome n=1 Tax=Acidimangrovimonas pyrenivorans TaxID=2030798 RepID=A0ABV7AH95_9RHOB
MFDTMTFTKILGAFCGALLIFLLGNWAAEGLYGGGEGGHGEEKQAYTIDTGATDTAAAKDQGPDFATVYASADPKKGERIFSKCKACHKVDGNNATGPHLNGVVGRDVASVPDFNYDNALKSLGGKWTPDRIQQFIHDPKKFAPGTKMGFAGLKKIEDRANVIAYLATLN